MSSTIGVQNIAHTNGTVAATVASDGGVYVKDHVLQVKQGILTTSFSSSTSSTAFENSPLNVVITPKSTSSKILITGMINFSANQSQHIALKVVKNGADFLLNTESAGNRTKAHLIYFISPNTIYSLIPGNVNLLDSPNTTSALTYTLQVGTPYAAAYQVHLNRQGVDSDISHNGRTVSTLTAMEIGG